MVIVRRLPHRWWWLALFTIIGPMLAIAAASVRELGGEGCSGVARGIARDSFAAPSGDVPAVDKQRIATTVPYAKPADAHARLRIGTTARSRTSSGPTGPAPQAIDPIAKRPDAGAPRAVRVVSHRRMRITRLHNGSILCMREVSSLHFVPPPLDPNDDTAAGDDSADDDDSRDDVNGDDDTESPAVACVQLMILYVVPPACGPVGSWKSPSFPPFPTLERLRC
jgi:hypothetical protein